jgi:hypothetical protein
MTKSRFKISFYIFIALAAISNYLHDYFPRNINEIMPFFEEILPFLIAAALLIFAVTKLPVSFLNRKIKLAQMEPEKFKKEYINYPPEELVKITNELQKMDTALEVKSWDLISKLLIDKNKNTTMIFLMRRKDGYQGWYQVVIDRYGLGTIRKVQTAL